MLQCAELWRRVSEEPRWNRDWALKATAAAQRLALSLASFGDGVYGLTQPHARAFQVRGVSRFLERLLGQRKGGMDREIGRILLRVPLIIDDPISM